MVRLSIVLLCQSEVNNKRKEPRLKSKEQTKRAGSVQDLDVKIVSYQHERIRRKKGTNMNSESMVETRV